MHTHNNTHWLLLKIACLLSGIPIGAIVCTLLLRRTRKELDLDRMQYQRVGLYALLYAFLQEFAVLASNFLPQRLQTLSIVGGLPILALFGILAALTGMVLVFVNSRGAIRYAAVPLGLLAITYAALTILAFMAGGI